MAKIITVEAEMGFSTEINKSWYKYGFRIHVQPEEGDDLAEIKKKAWNTCNIEIEKQVKATIDELNNPQK